MSENMNRRPVTANDVARALGLARATVSQYLGIGRLAKGHAAQRVRLEAHKMGYQFPDGEPVVYDQAPLPENPAQLAITVHDMAAALSLPEGTVRAYLKQGQGETAKRVREYAAKVGYDPKAAYESNRKYRRQMAKHYAETKIVTYYFNGNYHTKAEEIQRMKELRAAGYTNAEISKKIGRSVNFVWQYLGTQPAAMTEMSHNLANTTRKQKSAARAAYVRNKPIAEYNAKVQEHNELKAKLNALQVELLTEKPQIEQAAKIAVTAPQMNLVNLQPTALN